MVEVNEFKLGYIFAFWLDRYVGLFLFWLVRNMGL